MRRTASFASALVVLLLGCWALHAKVSIKDTQNAGAPERPDLIVIVLDSWRADALERQVGREPVMPRLSAWAEDVARFTQARAPSPSTPTSVSSLLSSLSVRAFGGTFKHGVPDRATTIAELLGRAGYRALAFSANPNCRAGLGHAQGFDVFDEAFSDPALADVGRRIRSDHPALLVPPEELFRRTREALLGHESHAPVFAYVHVLQPHAPYEAADPHAGRFVRKGVPEISLEIPDMVRREKSGRLDTLYLETLRAHYDEHVRWTDEALGDFLDWLESDPRWSRSAVIVTSDHGEAFGEHGRLLHNTTLFEEMLRVPFLMRLPGAGSDGRTVDERVGLIDLAPTLASLAGVEAPRVYEGVDLSPLARGERATPRRRFLASTAPRVKQDALLIGSWKLIRDGDETRLYDLEQDPDEEHDLSSVKKGKSAALERALDQLIERVGKAGVGQAQEQSHSDQVESILRSLGYTGGD